jgi:transcription initiation factor IIE alpha subunit
MNKRHEILIVLYDKFSSTEQALAWGRDMLDVGNRKKSKGIEYLCSECDWMSYALEEVTKYEQTCADEGRDITETGLSKWSNHLKSHGN